MSRVFVEGGTVYLVTPITPVQARAMAYALSREPAGDHDLILELAQAADSAEERPECWCSDGDDGDDGRPDICGGCTSRAYGGRRNQTLVEV
jgi:hypothetical protein